MRAVSLVLALSLLGCFPHNRRARTYAQLTEGAMIVGGIIMESMVKTGADCDQMLDPAAGTVSSCHSRNAAIGGVGVGLILGGLLGFIATISTAADDDPPKVEIKSTDATNNDKPALRPPPIAPAAAKPAASADAKPADAAGGTR